MGDLFFNKIAGVVIGGILIILVITELGHMLVKSHAPEELTAENTIYPVDWAALEGGAASSAEAVVEGPTDYGLLLAAADAGAGERTPAAASPAIRSKMVAPMVPARICGALSAAWSPRHRASTIPAP